MACDSELFRVDSFTVDGEEWPFTDDSATIEGAAGFERDVSPSSNGQDYTTRKRVQRLIKMKLQFTGAKTPDDVSKVCEAQIVMTNLHTGRRVRAGKCSFMSMGEIGTGPVDVQFAVLTPFQWL
ncbi:hypothetical protein ABEG10_07220 [Burkholderia cenocepacia]|uniref:hypothetical protein n=1 Tax=Burkholderia cepacia complex TaxID=87882 RepID=UPI0015897D40|nr:MULTISPECIES: hypothetical protein [Burkholderia cepacia complex]MCO8324275.1 hypothetical protein [Burkholderia cenocepacia]MCO8333206.1 hypothetical protein [Burkholderia cenocepacia]MCO8338845.1 hypothetical protein [Burkholderia cenocepacia]MCO8346131.1 hypothetical protein [Burkholderia cenocepacia]MCO8361191.1 hypothetical protein [Burkholderia cenocepacia]